MFNEPILKEHLPQFVTKSRFIFWVLTAYAILEIAGILLHPMWRDEMHFWSLSGASSSLSDLLRLKAWDGHPDLWYIMVYAVRRFTGNPLALQLMHAVVAILNAFLILRYAPFPRAQRVLLIFGYFFMFEYAIISRNYAIAILLVIVLLILYPHRNRLALLYASIMVVLVQTNIFGLIICMALLATWWFDMFWSGYFRQASIKQKLTHGACILLVILGIIYAVSSVLPPPSEYTGGATNFSLSQLTLRELIRSVGTVWRAWVPLPEITSRFWNTNIVGSAPVQAILSMVLLLVTSLIFIKRPVVFFLFAIGLMGMIGFIFIIFFGYLRHHGHLYLLLVFCLWLGAYYPENKIILKPASLNALQGWLSRHAAGFFTGLLILHLLVGAFAFTVQTIIPFSAGKQTAQYILRERLDRFPIAGDRDICLETVAGYLNKPLFFFSRNTFSTYMDYNPMNRNHPDETTMFKMADSLAGITNDTMLLVMSYPLQTGRNAGLFEVERFTSSIQGDEIYYLYLMPPKISGLAEQADKTN